MEEMAVCLGEDRSNWAGKVEGRLLEHRLEGKVALHRLEGTEGVLEDIVSVLKNMFRNSTHRLEIHRVHR